MNTVNWTLKWGDIHIKVKGHSVYYVYIWQTEMKLAV